MDEPNTPIDILLIEDNEADVFIIRRGFDKISFDVTLHHVNNGQEGIDFIDKEGPFAQSPTPKIVLLDLNMPVMDGRQFLEEMEARKLNTVPVIVLTTSESKHDVASAYRLGCNAYICKPVSFDRTKQFLETLCEFWLNVAELLDKS